MLLALRLVVVAGLLVSAYLHVRLAPEFALVGETITEAHLFLAQAVVAGASAMWLLLRDTRPGWIVAAVVGLVSLGALVVTVYVPIPAFGPFPPLYEPIWYAEKALAAAAAAVAGFGALPGVRRVPR